MNKPVFGIAARMAVTDCGSIEAAAKALRCEPEKIHEWLSFTRMTLPGVGGPDLWPLTPLSPKKLKVLKREIEVAIAEAARFLTPRRAVARFWDVDDSRLRRIGF